MPNSIIVSVIIPCFNGFKYVDKCIAALMNQTYKDFEVIFIDDCSTDGSYENLVEMSKTTTVKMSVLKNKMNRGPGYSREKGIKNAVGEYVCFCDIDDWYEIDFIESMLSVLKLEKADSVICDYYYVFKNESKSPANWYECIKNCNNKKELLIRAHGSLCITMVRRKLLLSIKFPCLYHGEDAAVIPLIITKSKTTSVCKKTLYNYLMREDSASNRFDRQAFDSSFDVYNFIKDHIDFKSYKNECEYLGIKGILYSGCLNAVKCRIDYNEIFKSIRLFKNYEKNVYYKELEYSKRIFIFFIKHRLKLFAKAFSILHTKLINK